MNTVPARRGSARLGELVRRHRRRAGLTQLEAACRADISPATLRNIEQGRVGAPRPNTVRRLAEALRLAEPDVDEFLSMIEADTPAEQGLQIGVLGPLQVTLNGSAIDIGSYTQRVLLGMLALSPHTPVSRDDLIDTAWGPRAPATVVDMLQCHMSRLRRRLGTGTADQASSRLLTATAGGYRLCVEDVQVDALAFERTFAQARATVCPSAAGELYARCARLWRGDPLTDIPPLQVHPAVARLSRLWQDVVVEYAAVAAELGRHAEVLPLLRQLADAEPLHEPAHARLMLALAACGQQASALELFDRLRRRLREDLGTDPGPEVRSAHQQVLRQDLGGATTAKSTLHQLPVDIAEFTGRSRELDVLHQQVPATRPPTTAVRVLAIEGMAGVGKTRLAVHFAHQLVEAGRYGEVQLYADLGANAARPAANPGAVLENFLRQLGVPGPEIPDDLDGRSTLYRDRLHGRHGLVLLDDADTLEQVLPLIPASPTNLVLITSRRTLGLDGTHTLALDVLTRSEAVALLTRIAGPARIPDDAAAAERVAHLCGYLPIALALAARRLRARPGRTLKDLAARMAVTTDRLDELSVGSRRLRTVFDFSYHALPKSTQRVFRLLGLHPGTEASSDSVAAMSGLTPSAARGHLERLTDEHLITWDAADRYRLHDLLREYAGTMAVEAGDDRREALRCVALWYAYAADRARAAMFPHLRDIVLDEGMAPEHLPIFATGEQAYRWLTGELPTVLAVIATAYEERFDDIAWQLPVILKHYFERSSQFDAWVETGRTALAAARRAGDRRGEGIVHGFLGIAAGQLGRIDMAIEHLSQGWRIADDVGDRLGAAKMLNNLALAYRAGGRLGDAVGSLRASLELAEEVDEQMLVTRVSSNLGWTYAKLEEHSRAISALRRSLELSRASGDPVGVVAALQHLGEALLSAGLAREAIPQLRDALALNRQLHFRMYEAETLEVLAEALTAVGEVEEARAHRREADVILAALDEHRRSATRISTSLSPNPFPCR